MHVLNITPITVDRQT